MAEEKRALKAALLICKRSIERALGLPKTAPTTDPWWLAVRSLFLLPSHEWIISGLRGVMPT